MHAKAFRERGLALQWCLRSAGSCWCSTLDHSSCCSSGRSYPPLLLLSRGCAGIDRCCSDCARAPLLRLLPLRLRFCAGLLCRAGALPRSQGRGRACATSTGRAYCCCWWPRWHSTIAHDETELCVGVLSDKLEQLGLVSRVDALPIWL